MHQDHGAVAPRRDTVDRLRLHAADRGAPIAPLGVYGLAGADFPADVRQLEHGLAAEALAREDIVLNDTFIALRAGTSRRWGVALICGQGINACAVAPDGRSARFDGVGDISGDWGGAGDVANAGLAAAVRGRDGRGPRTSLERMVPAHFGLKTPEALVRALYFERIPHRRLSELSRVVFAAATDGDEVARGIVDRLADELAGMAAALIRRLRLARLAPDIVLAGGVFRTSDDAFHGRLAGNIKAVAPDARLIRLAAPPVLGAALIGLDRLVLGAGGGVDPGGAPEAAEAAVRAALEAWHR